jgi:hypothetical protein
MIRTGRTPSRDRAGNSSTAADSAFSLEAQTNL